MTEYLRNRDGSTIGQIATNNGGRQTAYDGSGRTLGHYYPGSGGGQTTDASGRTVGYGNLLGSLFRNKK